MIKTLFPVFFPLYNLTICVERVLEKAQFDSVALVHSNNTFDIADNVYSELVKETNYAWMKFDMANNQTLQNELLKNNLFTKIFFVYFIDNCLDFKQIYNFIVTTKFDHRQNQIYIINKYPTSETLKNCLTLTFLRQFYNCGLFFWNSSGDGTGIKGYAFNGFKQNLIIPIPIIDDECSSDIYNQMFFDKTINFHRSNLTIYGQTEPPRVVRTIAVSNGQNERSIGGQDVLITDTIGKHFNASLKYKLMLRALYLTDGTHFVESEKPENSSEEKPFEVNHIFRYELEEPRDIDAIIYIYLRPAFDMNSQQVNYVHYLYTRRYKDFTFLYPHDTDQFIIVVPMQLKSKTEYSEIIKSPLITVWVPLTIVATVVRYIFNKILKRKKGLVDIYLQTFGLSLGMSFPATITSVSENLLLWWFCLATMLSGMILSSSMFQGFALQTNSPAINNLKELEMSGLPIHLPYYIEVVKYEFLCLWQKFKIPTTHRLTLVGGHHALPLASIFGKLLVKLVNIWCNKHFFEDMTLNLNLFENYEYSISEMIAAKNTSNAYVIREGKFNILFKEKDVWHVIQQFGLEHLSYKLHFYSALEDRMNIVIQRCVESGIINYLTTKNERLLRGVNGIDKNINSTIVKPVSVSDMQNSFLLYALGILFSSICFIAERIYFYHKKNTRNKYHNLREKSDEYQMQL